MDDLVSKVKHKSSDFTECKTNIILKCVDKIALLKNKLMSKPTRPTLKHPEATSNLALLHRKYVIVLINTASNNFAFISKNFYVSKLLCKSSSDNSTYLHINKERETTISENIKFCEKFGLKITEQ